MDWSTYAWSSHRTSLFCQVSCGLILSPFSFYVLAIRSVQQLGAPEVPGARYARLRLLPRVARTCYCFDWDLEFPQMVRPQQTLSVPRPCGGSLAGGSTTTEACPSNTLPTPSGEGHQSTYLRIIGEVENTSIAVHRELTAVTGKEQPLFLKYTFLWGLHATNKVETLRTFQALLPFSTYTHHSSLHALLFVCEGVLWSTCLVGYDTAVLWFTIGRVDRRWRKEDRQAGQSYDRHSSALYSAVMAL